MNLIPSLASAHLFETKALYLEDEQSGIVCSLSFFTLKFMSSVHAILVNSIDDADWIIMHLFPTGEADSGAAAI
jgi:hypothetical protein